VRLLRLNPLAARMPWLLIMLRGGRELGFEVVANGVASSRKRISFYIVAAREAAGRSAVGRKLCGSQESCAAITSLDHR
jgi:hypothetical protein